MKWLFPVLAVLMIGCHTSARDATFGVLDAIERPDPHDPLSMKIHTLADRYVDGALKAAPGPGLDALLADAVVSVLKAAQMHAPEELAMMQVAVRAAVLTSIATLKEQVPDPGRLSLSSAALGSGLVDGVARHEDQIVSMLARGSGEVGRAFAREAADQLFTEVGAQLGPDGDGPLSRALAGSLQRAAGAIVGGAVGRAPGDVALHTSADPLHGPADVVRSVSRSAAMGAAEGVGREVNLWGLCAAALAGVLLAVAGHWIVRRWAPSSRAARASRARRHVTRSPRARRSRSRRLPTSIRVGPSSP